MIDTKSIGEISEIKTILEFKKRSIPVLLPYGDNLKFDICVIINNKFYRIQVKTGRYCNGCIMFNSSASTYDMENGRGRKTVGYKGLADLFAVYYPEKNLLLLVPVDEVGETSVLLRIDTPKNGVNSKHIKWAYDYDFDKQLEKLGAMV